MSGNVRALTFDVFGTVVDWRGTIIREGRALRPSLDWERIADEWRGLYQPTLARVTRGELAWMTFDLLQRLMLDQVIDTLGVAGVGDADRAYLSGLWARLDAWPDAAEGLTRLKQSFIVCALSNGSVRQLVGIARHAGLAWDMLFSVELFRAYKPDPRVYRGAAELLQCETSEVMMVAAHVNDLRAAREVGMRTAYVARPMEWGGRQHIEQPEPGEFDVVARDFVHLAEQLQTAAAV